MASAIVFAAILAAEVFGDARTKPSNAMLNYALFAILWGLVFDVATMVRGG